MIAFLTKRKSDSEDPFCQRASEPFVNFQVMRYLLPNLVISASFIRSTKSANSLFAFLIETLGQNTKFLESLLH